MTATKARSDLPGRVMLVSRGWQRDGEAQHLAMDLVHAGVQVGVFYAGLEARPGLGAYGRRVRRSDALHLLGIYNHRQPRPGADPLRDADQPEMRAAFSAFLAEFQPELVHFLDLQDLGLSLVEVCRAGAIPTCWTARDYWPICSRGDLFNSQQQACPGPRQADCMDCISPQCSHAEFAARQDAGWLTLRCGFDAVLCASERSRQVLVDHGADPDQTRVLRLPPPDLDRLWEKVGRRRAAFAARDRALRVGYVGELSARSGVRTLVAALQEIPATQVQGIVFSGGDRAQVDHLRGLDLHARLSYRTLAPGHDLQEVFSSMDVLVVPGLWELPWPELADAARAARCPILGARAGGIPESFVDGAEGMGFAPGDTGSLAALLRRLGSEGELLDRLRAALPRPESRGEQFEALWRVYRGLIGTRRPAAAAAGC